MEQSSTCNNDVTLQNELLRLIYIHVTGSSCIQNGKEGRASDTESRLLPLREHQVVDLIMTFSVYSLLQCHGNWEPQNIKERALKENLESYRGKEENLGKPNEKC